MTNKRGRPKILSPSLEAWFNSIYPSTPNDTIAKKLTNKYNEERQAEKEKLEKAIENKDRTTRLQVEKRIRVLTEFVSFEERDVLRYANRLGVHKTQDYLYMMRKTKMEERNFSKMIAGAKLVDNFTAELRSLRFDCQRAIKVKGEKKMMSFATLLCRWNKAEGRRRGMKVSASYDYSNCIILLTPQRL